MTATTAGCIVFFNAMRRPRPGTCFGHGERCSDAIGGMRLANVKLSMLIGDGLLGTSCVRGDTLDRRRAFREQIRHLPRCA